MAATQHVFEMIIDQLTRFLSRGLLIDQEVIDFAETTYDASRESMIELLQKDSSDTRETLLALILVPTDQVREAIEPLLKSGITNENEEAIARHLHNAYPLLELYTPGVTASVQLALESDDYLYYIRKLYGTRQLDKSLTTILEKYLEEPLYNQALVYQRKADSTFHPATIPLIEIIVQKIASVDEKMDLLMYTFGLFSEYAPEKSVYQFLFDRVDLLKKNLQEIEEFEEKRDKYGMEYLMMQKYPVPCDSAEIVEDQLRTLEYLVLDLLNLNGALHKNVENLNLGTFDPDADLERFFKKFR